MNTNLLKARSLSKEQAYVLFFIFQAPYAYVGRWKIQLLYWFVCLYVISSIYMISTGEIGGVIILFLFLIWPVNQFFAIPNKIKRHNLKIYEELLTQK